MHKKDMLMIENLSLAFPVRMFRQTTFRDTFIDKLSNPFKKEDKQYFLALDGINLNFKDGARVGLIGLNGSGKTTLCRCISGFYSPRAGKIVRNGKVRALFDSSLAIYPELSGRENLEVMAQVFYDHEKNIQEIIEESIVFSELGPHIDLPVKTYSKGMLLRLTMSLLSAKPADVLILDEVFDGADEFFKSKLAVRIRNLIDTSGVVIFVSHQEEQIRDICDQVVVMERGRMLFAGDIDTGYQIYRDRSNAYLRKKLDS